MSYTERSQRISADLHRAISDLQELIREQVASIVARTQIDAVRAQEQTAILMQRVERLAADVESLRTLVLRHMTDDTARLDRIEALMMQRRDHD